MSDISPMDQSERSPLLSETPPIKGTRSDHDDPGSIAPSSQTSDGGTPESARFAALEQFSKTRLTIILATLYFEVFLGALDVTVVATLAAPISDEFDSLSLLSWIASAYLIGNAALRPIAGRLTDIFSRRSGLIVSNILFGIGTLVCAIAPSGYYMIAGRILAGLGAGGIISICTFVTSDLIPLRRRGLFEGINNIFFYLGSSLGGLFGGFMNDTYGWRSAFHVQLPFIALSTMLVIIYVHVPTIPSPISRLRRIDYLGAFTLVLSLVLFLLAINSIGSYLPWTHPLVLTCLPLSLITLLIFIYVEARYASEPIIPVALLLDRTIAAACLTNLLVNMVWLALLFYLPIWIQLRGHSTTAAGVRLIPFSVGASLGSLGAGFLISRTGKYYILSCITSVILVGALGAACTISLTSPEWPSYIVFFMCGVGNGSIVTITMIALIAAAPQSAQAVITSAFYAFRSVGGVMGITVASAVFQNVLHWQLWERLGWLPDAAELIEKVKKDFDLMQLLRGEIGVQVRESYMKALLGVFGTSFGLGVLGAIANLCMREHKLHSTLSRK